MPVTEQADRCSQHAHLTDEGTSLPPGKNVAYCYRCGHYWS